MTIRKIALACSVLLPLAALAACEDEKTAQAPPPAPAPQTEAQKPEPPPADGKSATDTALEGLNKLRDAAEQAVKEAQPTIDRAKEATEQALKDAQPHIDKAKEAMKQIGQSVQDIVTRAQDDLKKATEELERRLNEAQSQPPAPVGDPAATLAAADRLRADTRAAARAGGTSMVPAYVGVWASKAEECAKVDLEPLEMFAVITPTSIRRYESVCNIPETAMSNGAATLSAECIAEGDVETRQLTFRMSAPDRLSIAVPEGAGPEMVRCHLPR